MSGPILCKALVVEALTGEYLRARADDESDARLTNRDIARLADAVMDLIGEPQPKVLWEGPTVRWSGKPRMERSVVATPPLLIQAGTRVAVVLVAADPAGGEGTTA